METVACADVCRGRPIRCVPVAGLWVKPLGMIDAAPRTWGAAHELQMHAKGNDMHNVTMLCAAGTSTHIFAVKVQEELDAENAPVRVNAWSVAQAKEKGVESELILLTPQVQFEAELVHALFPDKRVEIIDFNTFAEMDTKAAADQIKELLGL